MRVKRDQETEDRSSRSGGEKGKVEYFLYDWYGKCKWAYLFDTFLVDPRYEPEFKKQHRV